MDDLIDRDALLRTRLIETAKIGADWTADDLAAQIETAPAVDAAPVVHGSWVKETDRTNHWHCSRCNSVWGQSHAFFNYCPHCGAKMDGGERDGN